MAWIAAGAAIGGAVLSNMGASDRNDAQIASSREQMEFQKYMSNTAYRRAVRDMQKAGLNPMLAYSQGGASTPAGSQANIEDAITPAINTGKDIYRSTTEAAVRKEQVGNIAADTGLKTAETEKAQTEAALNLARVETEKQNVVHSAADVELKGAQKEQIVESIKKVAPEIQEIVSRTNLNYATRQKLLAELPLIAANVGRTKAETLESYERRLLTAVETRIHSLKENESKAYSDMYGTDYGQSLPYVHSGASVAKELGSIASPYVFGRGVRAGSKSRGGRK